MFKNCKQSNSYLFPLGKHLHRRKEFSPYRRKPKKMLTYQEDLCYDNFCLQCRNVNRLVVVNNVLAFDTAFYFVRTAE